MVARCVRNFVWTAHIRRTAIAQSRRTVCRLCRAKRRAAPPSPARTTPTAKHHRGPVHEIRAGGARAAIAKVQFRYNREL